MPASDVSGHGTCTHTVVGRGSTDALQHCKSLTVRRLMMIGTNGALSQYELLTLLFGVLGTVFILLNRPLLARLPRRALLVAAYLLLVVAWATACVDGAAREPVPGLVERLCWLGSAVLLAVWCWTALRARPGAEP